MKLDRLTAIAGLALAAAPIMATQTECRVIPAPRLDCTPTGLSYSPAPPACDRS